MAQNQTDQGGNLIQTHNNQKPSSGDQVKIVTNNGLADATMIGGIAVQNPK